MSRIGSRPFGYHAARLRGSPRLTQRVGLKDPTPRFREAMVLRRAGWTVIIATSPAATLV